MFPYVLKRLLLLVVTLFGITVLTFALTRLTPGDPASIRVASAQGSQAVGGYDNLVELNRRNLGLDKPLVLNLRFEDRVYTANRHLDDYLRSEEFWRDAAERELRRMSTIALKPALDRLVTLRQKAGEQPTEEQAEGMRRLADLMPRIAGERVDALPREPAAAAAFWSDWYAANRERFAEPAVREAVTAYLDEGGDEAFSSVRHAGGFAVPYLVAQLDTPDDSRLRRVNRALEAQTGFTFLANEEAFDDMRGEIVARWQSWWRRESISYLEFSPAGHALNMIANTQFGLWTRQALTFDFGDSYAKRRPVTSMIAEALPVSALLSGISILLSYLIAIPIGVFSAVKRHSPADRLLTVILFALYSLPSFWVAGMLLLTTTGPPFLDLFPTRGLVSQGEPLHGSVLLDRLWHLVLPVFCLSYTSLAFISRQMRTAMLETINEDFIRTARAKGLPPWIVVWKHALRNSLLPILTISAGLLPELIAGAIIIESIFSIPGMGTLTFEAIVNRDYPVINAVLFFSAFLTLLGILLVDLSYALVDPRITYS